MADWFEECHHCVAPKRHPGCHDHCPDYIRAKAKYDQKRIDAREQSWVSSYVKKSIVDARDSNVKRLKGNRRFRYGGGN